MLLRKQYFIDIKKYGYFFNDKNNNYINKSVIAGVERNSITFDEIKNIFYGKEVIKEIPIRYYKSFKDLSITIKSTIVSITNTNKKKQKIS